MQFSMDVQAPQWYTGYAWAFLEDVYRMRTASMSGDNRMWHVARTLGACATNLRNACEAQFGEQKLDRAPNQGVMWFITAARHLSAHIGQAGTRMDTRDLKIHWSNQKETGWAEVGGSLTMDLEASRDLKVMQRRDLALRFFRSHEERLYPALHAATRIVADWTGTPLDSDFEAIGKEDHGRVILRLPLQSSEHMQQMLEAAQGQGQGDFRVSTDDLERKTWSVHGVWAEQDLDGSRMVE